MSKGGQREVKERSMRGQGKVKVRSRQRKHNLNHNYNLMGFDTIEINLVSNNLRQLSTISMAILGNFETTMIQKQSMVILVNYKENYDTTTTTIQWVLTSVQFNLVYGKVIFISNPTADGWGFDNKSSVAHIVFCSLNPISQGVLDSTHVNEGVVSDPRLLFRSSTYIKIELT